MKWLNRTFVFVVVAGVYTGCSDVEFGAKPSQLCVQAGKNCVVTPDGYYQFSGSTKTGRVDILFVTDNSGSMYTEQSQMADRFPNFLYGISNLDYQIAIITSDVSASPGNSAPRAANGNGAFQDGKFLQFNNSSYVLNNSTTDVVEQFRNTIKRPETLRCDQSGYTDCPSGDERPIYALNMAFDRNQNGFFRDGAHLAVVILSDENERSTGGTIPGYPMETNDYPETLVSKLNTLWADKVMSVHSVIVQPGDQNCINIQNGQGVNIRGYEGTYFAALSSPSDSLKSLGNIVPGHTGSICESDYGAQMGDIGASITQNTNLIQLACDPMDNADGSTSLQVTFDPAPPQQIGVSVDGQNRIVLSPPAPAGTTVNYSYKCPRI